MCWWIMNFSTLLLLCQIFSCFLFWSKELLYKKWRYPLRITSVYVTRSTENCGLVKFIEEILNGKLFAQWIIQFRNRSGREEEQSGGSSGKITLTKWDIYHYYCYYYCFYHHYHYWYHYYYCYYHHHH